MKLSTMVIILIVAATPYMVNGYKLANCDFESDYKCEAIHAIGAVVPPLSFITMWFSSDAGA